MKKWEVQQTTNNKQQVTSNEIIELLLENRGIKTKEEKELFLHSKLEEVTMDSVGIDKKELKKALARIKKAITKKEQIVVYGDYDVDGICGSAILWETLHVFGAKVTPYIPHRVDEGYGLSIKGIEALKSQVENVSLIITVDNGIVAHEAVEFANKQGIDVIITDHHVLGKTIPKACAIVHTTKLCGTGVAWLLSQELKKCHSEAQQKNPTTQGKRSFVNTQDDKNDDEHNHLELVALATVADLVPLLGANRILTKFGLKVLRETKRTGLLELYKEAGLDQSKIGVYEIGHIIAPRLNAMGRLEYAMDSLRLLCTSRKERAEKLAHLLGVTNKERQQLTEETVQHARDRIRNQKSRIKKLLFISDESYQPGIIGLVAGKLVEEFYRPSIVLSIGETYSKASARSVNGFNIIEFIRTASELLVDAGGHPMAAGFTVETAKLSLLQKTLEERAHEVIAEELLMKKLRIDCELPFGIVNEGFHSSIQKLAPFGMGNPEPVFVSREVRVNEIRIIGKEGKHLKLKFKATSNTEQAKTIDAVAFGMGDKAKEIHAGDTVDIAYAIDMNEWNGNRMLQLKIKDLKTL